MKIQRYNPHDYDVERSYTCEHEFNYTTNPNFFTCYNEENSTLIFKALKNISQGEEIFIRYRKKGEECLAPEYLGRIFK